MTIVLWKETACPLWRAMDRHSNRNVIMLVSSVMAVMRLPISCASSVAMSCHVPAVSLRQMGRRSDCWPILEKLSIVFCAVLWTDSVSCKQRHSKCPDLKRHIRQFCSRCTPSGFSPGTKGRHHGVPPWHARAMSFVLLAGSRARLAIQRFSSTTPPVVRSTTLKIRFRAGQRGARSEVVTRWPVTFNLAAAELLLARHDRRWRMKSQHRI